MMSGRRPSRDRLAEHPHGPQQEWAHPSLPHPLRPQSQPRAEGQPRRQLGGGLHHSDERDEDVRAGVSQEEDGGQEVTAAQTGSEWRGDCGGNISLRNPEKILSCEDQQQWLYWREKRTRGYWNLQVRGRGWRQLHWPLLSSCHLENQSGGWEI